MWIERFDQIDIKLLTGGKILEVYIYLYIYLFVD